MLTSVCCMRLRTFAWVFGCLDVLFSIKSTLDVSWALEHVDKVVDAFIDKYNPSGTKADLQTAFVIIFKLYLVHSAINILAAALLVFGAVQKRHRFLVPWLINNGWIVVCLVILLLKIFINQETEKFESEILISLPVLALGCYLYYGIYSLYKEIKASKYTIPGLYGTEFPNINSYPRSVNV